MRLASSHFTSSLQLDGMRKDVRPPDLLRERRVASLGNSAAGSRVGQKVRRNLHYVGKIELAIVNRVLFDPVTFGRNPGEWRLRFNN
jgi:hypothetical protein